MKINGKDYQSLWREQETFHFIDQRKLPNTFEIYSTKTIDDIAYAIKEMVVRGAPAIGAAAAYGMAIGNKNPERTATFLRTTRPTAYDLFHAIEYMNDAIQQGKNAFSAATLYAQTIISRCKKIGEHGEKLIKDSMRILTHCNAGALATIDYGTALAPIRLAHENKKELFVYVDETRLRLQGVLTAWELYHEGIPHVVIADNAAGYYMRKKDIDLVIVGADRIAKNGDFANKIGTYYQRLVREPVPSHHTSPMSGLLCLYRTHYLKDEHYSPRHL